MAISEAVEARMAEARAARNKQDKKHPLLINIEDGRLVPNVPRLGGRKGNPALKEPDILPHPKYRPYLGDPKASLKERMHLLTLNGITARAAVIDSGHLEVMEADANPPPPPFDIGKADRSQLVEFALASYGTVLDEKGDTHMATLRAQVRALATGAGDLG